MIIVIPAYEPDHRLVQLIAAIRRTGSPQPVVIVDDGSGPDYAAVFDAVEALGCDVIGYSTNAGKGHALKHGFTYIAKHYPRHDVVCADCDGQHTLVDILRVADALHDHRDGIVLGARQFAGDVPLRSRIGNDATRFVFRLSTGLRLQDTQTGLRGYPAWMLGWLTSVEGERFEYELEVLLASRRLGLPIREVAIATVYLDGNESSHFHPVRDSIRVYVPFLKFSASSLAAFAIDTTLFLGLMWLTGHLLLSVVTARLVSASVNFIANRRLVFGLHDRGPAASAVRYAGLVVALMAANYTAMHTLVVLLDVPLVPAKFVTELVLFVASYRVQQRFVFGEHVAQHRAILGELPGATQVDADLAELQSQS